MPSNQQASQTPIHAEYRNGTYYGMMSADYNRDGKGLLILDSSTVLFAEWNHNRIEGSYIYITDQTRAFGQMKDGKLEGFNMIYSTGDSNGGRDSSSYHRRESISRTFYCMFSADKLYGKAVLVDNDQLLVMQFNNNQMEEVVLRKSLRERDAYETLADVFPNYTYTLDEFLTSFMKAYVAEIEQIEEISRFEPCISFFPNDQKFYGFQESLKNNKKFGILMLGNEVISIGEHDANLLHGVGRLYAADHILDGIFFEGKLDGIGIEYTRSTNKFILGEHGNNSRVEKGFGFPLREILEIRKQFHLRSVFFYNDIALLNMKAKYESQIANILQFSRRTAQSEGVGRSPSNSRNHLNSHSGKRTVEKSPLRNKLSKYQDDADFIEDNSPIKKNTINEYRPVERAFNSYFNQPDSSRQREPSNHEHYNSRYSRKEESYSSQRNAATNSEFERRRSHKKEERQIQQQSAYQEILRRGIHNQHANSSSRNASSRSFERREVARESQQFQKEHSQNVRDDHSAGRSRKKTQDLVRELDEQERGRRDVLDQIYRKSGIYGRR